MYIQQLYTKSLGEAAYYIESNGEAAVVDPLRDVEPYLALAAERKAVIKYIFETHFHADFISGHLDMARATGAPIIYGPGTETNFPVHVAKDGELFPLGALQVKVLHTPGHTIESTCYLLLNENGQAHALFTGDTLFVDGVGRPDLSSGTLSKEELASMMYDSLYEKILTLPDNVIVYPAHGPRSHRVNNAGTETSSTIGDQKLSNTVLKAATKEEFIATLTRGLKEPPQYFPINAKINKEGYESMDDLLLKSLKPLDLPAFTSLMKDAMVVDTRPPELFTEGFVPGSINIGLEGRFGEWAGSLLPFQTSILLVTEAGKEKETLIKLARVGFNKVEGYLEGGIETWQASGEPSDMILNIEPDELMMDLRFDENLVVLDVRRETEFADGHLKDAVNIPLNDLTDPGSMANLEDHHNIYVHCGGGYRSVIAASLLKRQGIHNVRNVSGGWEKIREQEKVEVVKDASLLN